jgi:hypothetical protein
MSSQVTTLVPSSNEMVEKFAAQRNGGRLFPRKTLLPLLEHDGTLTSLKVEMWRRRCHWL